MNREQSVLAIAVAVLATVGASAALAQIVIQTVPVGDPGNLPDTRTMSDSTTGYGAVAYAFNIGKYEVTAGEYGAFLNSVARTDTNGVFSSIMSNSTFGCGITRSGTSGDYTYSVSGPWVNRPVHGVSFWSALRFANWLHNGQPVGPQNNSTTEDGAYTLTAGGIASNTVVRSTGWRWAVTSENEWYKAAYFKGDGANAGYWLYATRSDSPPGYDTADLNGNNANHACQNNFMTLIGEFQNSPGPYGTFDQAGNASEWTDSITQGSFRVVRGGDYCSNPPGGSAIVQAIGFPADATSGRGFRVSQAGAPVNPCVGDLNGDNAVNTADLTRFLGLFGTTTTPGGTGDFNGDGAVNTADLTRFLGRFGSSC